MQRLLPVVLAALALVGCWQTHPPTIPVVVAQSAPAPDSPQNAVRRLQFCWANLDTLDYLDTITNDFVFSSHDLSGDPLVGTPWGLADERRVARRMFAGADGYPPMLSVQLALDNDLLALPDARPGKTPRWHRVVSTSVVGHFARAPQGIPEAFTVNGSEVFYLVRGDSAEVPNDLAGRRYLPDSTRWWVERLEDIATPIGGPGAHADPAGQVSWGYLRVLYLGALLSAPPAAPAARGH